MTPGGKWYKVVFCLSAAALLLSAYRMFGPARRVNLEAYKHRVVLPPPPEVPDSSSALPGRDIKEYWEEGRMVWVQPVLDKGPVRVDLSLPRPTLAVSPMPLPDPSPLLEHCEGLPRWGQVPRAGLEEDR